MYSEHSRASLVTVEGLADCRLVPIGFKGQDLTRTRCILSLSEDLEMVFLQGANRERLLLTMKCSIYDVSSISCT